SEEFRRAAFILADMGLLMGEDRAPGPGDAGEGERVRSGAGQHEEDRNLMLEDGGEARLDGLRPVVLAIGGEGAVIGCGAGGHDTRAGADGVVAEEIHAAGVGERRAAAKRRIWDGGMHGAPICPGLRSEQEACCRRWAFMPEMSGCDSIMQ